MKNILFLLITLCTISFSYAQRGKISGKVFNTRNESLGGVTIKITNGTNGITTTNIEGRFSINIEVGKKYDLTFSYVGYTEKIIEGITITKAGDDETVDVVLEENKKSTSEVTVKTTARGNGKGGVVAIQHPANHRRMSVRESALVQTFPINFEFIGSMGSMYRQVGNAVPVLFGQHLGKKLKQLEAELV